MDAADRQGVACRAPVSRGIFSLLLFFFFLQLAGRGSPAVPRIGDLYTALFFFAAER
jgi:hypothetical protein